MDYVTGFVGGWYTPGKHISEGKSNDAVDWSLAGAHTLAVAGVASWYFDIQTGAVIGAVVSGIEFGVGYFVGNSVDPCSGQVKDLSQAQIDECNKKYIDNAKKGNTWWGKELNKTGYWNYSQNATGDEHIFKDNNANYGCYKLWQDLKNRPIKSQADADAYMSKYQKLNKDNGCKGLMGPVDFVWKKNKGDGPTKQYQDDPSRPLACRPLINGKQNPEFDWNKCHYNYGYNDI